MGSSEEIDELSESLSEAIWDCNKDKFKKALAEIGDVSKLRYGDYESSAIDCVYQRIFRPADVFYFVKLLIDHGLEQRDYEKFFIDYFSLKNIYDHYQDTRTTKQIDVSDELFNYFIDLGISRDFITAALIGCIQLVTGFEGYANRKAIDHLKYLLEAGADPNKILSKKDIDYTFPFKKSKTAMDNLIFATPSAVIDILAEYGADFNNASEADQLYLWKKGLIENIDPNIKGADGMTVVTRNLRAKDWPDVVSQATLRLLKKAGADFSLADGLGDTPLYCLFDCSPDIKKFDYLLKNGANPNGVSNGQTPLVMALDIYGETTQERVSAQIECIDLLVSYGADVFKSSGEEESFLNAIVRWHPELSTKIRKHIDKPPKTLIESILFSGFKGLTNFISDKSRWATNDLTPALEYAIRARDKKSAQLLIDQGADISSLFEGFKWYDQEDSDDVSYEMPLLKFFSKLESPELENLWNDILSIDKRKNARKLAEDNLAKFVGKRQASKQATKLAKQTLAAKQSKQADIKKIAEAFVSQLRQLFKSLTSDGIYAFDIDGTGWAPGHHGLEVAHEMLGKHLGKPQTLLTMMEIQGTNVFYTDTKHLTIPAQWLESGALRSAVASSWIYFDGEDDALLKSNAKTLIERAKNFGLKAEWSGEMDGAIYIQLA